MKKVLRSEMQPGMIVLEEEAYCRNLGGAARNRLTEISRPFIILKILISYGNVTITSILDSRGKLLKFNVDNESVLYVQE